MAGLMRAKARNLDVVAEQIGILGDDIVFTCKKLFLIVKTRPPSEVGADFEILAEAVSQHVRRVNPLGRVGVMGATGGVDMVIARPPAHQRRINPALDFECLDSVRIGDGDGSVLRQRLGAAIKSDIVLTGWQSHMLAITTINLRMKVKVGRKPLGLRRIHAAKAVTDFKTGGCRHVVFVEYLERDFVCRLAVEEQVNFAAKTEVLRSLANVEAELGIALAGVAAVKLHDAILQGQAAERLGERLGIVHRQAKPSIDDLALRRTGMGARVWAAGVKFGSDPGLVADFDEEVAPALLD